MPQALLVLDDAAIRTMLKNPQIVNAFPFMKAAAAAEVKSGKKKCNCGSKTRQNVNGYDGIKAAIAGLSNENKGMLKTMLDVQQIRLYYKSAKSQTVKLTF